MATEYVDGPPAKVSRVVCKNQTPVQGRASMLQPEITDDTVDFGSEITLPGFAAFSMRAGQIETTQGKESAPVFKAWVATGGRNLLVDRVEYSSAMTALLRLPLAKISIRSPENRARDWPPVPPVETGGTSPMATGSLPDEPGFVLDPNSGFVSYSAYSFVPGTYYVSGLVVINGACSFSSNCFIKFARNQYITINGPASGGGAVLTAVDDNSDAGAAIIPGSSGSPSDYYAPNALWFVTQQAGTSSLSNMEFRFATTGVALFGPSGYSLTLNSPKFKNNNPATASVVMYANSSATMTVNNGWFCGVQQLYSGTGPYPTDQTCANTSPTVSSIGNTTQSASTRVAYKFTIGDTQTPESLNITVSSSNASIVPNDASHLWISGTSLTERWLNVVTSSATSGTTTNTITVSDGAQSASTAFVITAAASQVLKLEPIPDCRLMQSSTSKNITVHISDTSDTTGNSVNLTFSSPSGLIQTNISTYSLGNTRTIQVTPVLEKTGDAVIAVSAVDGSGNSASTTFTAHILAEASNPDRPPPFVTIGPGGPGSGGYFGPGGFIDLDAIRNLVCTGHSTCDDSSNCNILDQPTPATADIGSADDNCPTGDIYYHLRITFSAYMPNGGGAQSARAYVGSNPQAVYARISAPEVTQTSCAVTVSSKTVEILVHHRDKIALGYAVGFCGEGKLNPGMYGVERPETWIDDVQLIDVSTTGPNGPFVCPQCVGSFGTDVGTVSSVLTGFRLGAQKYGRIQNYLTLFQQAATPMLTSAESIFMSTSPSDGVDVVPDPGNGNYIRQIMAPVGLVDIVVTNDHAYSIGFYSTNALGNAGVKSNGLYVLTPGATPTESYAILNPSGSTNNPNSLQLVESRAGLLITNQYIFVPATTNWQYSRGNGAHLEERQYLTNGNAYSVSQIIRDPVSTNSIIWKQLQNVQMFSWGSAISNTVVDPGGANLTTTYSYFTNATDAGYGKLQQVNYTNGGWQIIDYDTFGRTLRIYSAFLTQTNTTNSALCGKVEYDYTPISASGDTGAYRPNLPRQEVTYLLGQEIGRKYYVYKKGEKQEIVCTTPGAAWNDANNLVTITKRLTSGVFKDELLSVKKSDGTLTLYQYSTNSTSKTTTVLAGQPDTAGTNVVDGTKIVTQVGLAGQMMLRQVYDIASSVLLDQQTYSNYDAQQRPGTVTFLDGTTEVTQYGCCGPDSVQARDGTITSYGYDALRRKTSETVNGITTIYAYDGANRVIAVTRQGTNGNQVLQHGYTYDVAGRLIAETNAVGVITTRVEAVDLTSGQSTKTTTYASGTSDQCTRVETYARDGALLKVTGTAVNPVRYDYGVELESGTYRTFKKEIKLDASGNDTGEWTKTYTDMAGRAYKTVYSASSGTPNVQSYFNTAGQLTKQIDPDGVTALYAYNAKGELQDSVSDTNRNGTIDYTGLDRINRTIRDVVNNPTYGTYVQRSRTFVFPNDNDGVTTNETSRVETSVDGLRSWSTSFGLITKIQTGYPGGGVRYVTNTAPDASYVISYYLNGLLQSVTKRDSGGVQLGLTTYTYDPHGRVATLTDARNGTTSYTYDNADRVLTVTTPPPGNGQSPQTTTSYYDNMGRVWKVLYQDGTSITNQYYTTGLLYQTSGSRTYPVRYTYDAQGRVKTMTTWTSFSSGTGAAVTTWNYDSYRGWLASKLDANNYGTSYTYTTAGRLTYTTWARSGQYRGVVYDNIGLVAYTYYPSGPTTPYFNYDRRNRMNGVTQGGNVTTFYYNDAGQLLGSYQSGGTLSGFALTNQYDGYLRKSYVAVKAPSGTWYGGATYGYDNASRLASVAGNSATVTYGYVANSPLIGNITEQQSGTTRLTVNKSYDYLNRLMSVSSTPSGGGATSYGYGYNDANQRVQMYLADGSFWIYQYDSLGQVKSAKRYWNDWTPVAGQQYEYGCDDIGNRSSTKAGGDAGGTSLRSASYSPNTLNQYSSRAVPGAADVLGIANAGATVTVNSQATYRRGEYFDTAITINNASSPVYQALTTWAVNGSASNSVSGNVLLPAATESYSYDLDGNALSDGLWSYTWDGENRLVQIQSVSGVPNTAKRQLTLEYDYLGRRISKTVKTTSDGITYANPVTTKYFYDGWNLLGEFDGSNALIRSYYWGLDASGSMQGAGGVGGLVAVVPVSGTTYFPAFDGNGNVTGQVSGSTGQFVTQFEYGPFGEVIRATSSVSPAIPIRWSTKYTDLETDLVYYGHRYYNPSTGRWLSRDPVEEKGGLNPYWFVANDPLNSFDALGLAKVNLKYVTYIEPATITFAGRTFNGGVKTRHEVQVDTDSQSLSTVEKYIGATIEYDNTGRVIGRGQAKGTTVQASVDAHGPGRGRGEPYFRVKMSGDESNPLVTGAPGITYEVYVYFYLCSHKMNWNGTHDRFPSHDFYEQGKLVHHFSHVTAGTTPASLFPTAKSESFTGEDTF